MEVLAPNGQTIVFPDSMSQEQIKVVMNNKFPSIDNKTGASLKARLAVGSSTDKDKLATLKNFYPDAVEQTNEKNELTGNYVFTNPKTNKPTLFNEKGFSMGDVAQQGNLIAELVGGIGAGLLATPPAVASAPFTGGASLLGIPTAIGLGASAGNEMTDLYLENFGGKVDTRDLPQRTIDAANTVGVNAIGQRGGDLLFKGIGKALSPVKEKIKGYAPEIKQLLDKFKITPTAGQATGNPILQTTENILEAIPFSKNEILNAKNTTADQIEKAFFNTLDNVATPLTDQGAGNVATTGASQSGINFGKNVIKLDDKIDEIIPADTPININKVISLKKQLIGKMNEAQESTKPIYDKAIKQIAKLEKDAVNGTIGFGALKTIRSSIGKNLERPDISGYTPAEESSMRKIYGALAESIKSGIKDNKEGLRAFNIRDRYIKFYHNVTEPVLEDIIKKKSDEKALQYITNLTKDNLKDLRILKNTYKPEEWDVVLTSILSKGSKNKEGVFQTENFLKFYSSLSNEAKNVIFSGKRYKGLNKDLDELTSIMNKVVNKSGTKNPSGTAQFLFNGFLGVELISEVAKPFQEGGENPNFTKLGFMALTPKYTAKLLTSKPFVNWLITGSKLKPNKISSHIARLGFIAKANPEIADAIYSYNNQLGE